MSLFETLARWLRPPDADRRPPLWTELRDRGADREVIRYAEAFGSDLARAWTECGRADWCIEIASRVGVGRALVERSVEDLAACQSGEGRAVGPARDAARAFAEQRGTIEELVQAVGALSAALVEAEPEVRLALERVDSSARRDFAAQDEFDQIYRSAQRDLADIVRRRISAGEVRVALEGLESHPYR